MSQKISEFKALLDKCLLELKFPEVPIPKLSDPDTNIWSRLEKVVAPIATIAALLIATPGVVYAVAPHAGSIEKFWPIMMIVGQFFLWSGITAIGVVYSWLRQVIEYITDPPTFYFFILWEEYWEGVGLVFTRPVSLVLCLPAYAIKLRRFRREVQVYKAKLIKIIKVQNDLSRPDAEDLFSGIEDLKMFESYLNN